ncbi:isopentenyl-diphosphate delta-isomerase [Halobacteriovorax sp.]|uniref:isopentenyl-diphosphate delta-isomerase n=1 Tax=Halobacteriovorax sp. TaxID=2020862 RepID=UPI0035657396
MGNLSDRKYAHIQLANDAQTEKESLNKLFDYEPIFSAHPQSIDLSKDFLGKRVQAPLWISSMTGGTGDARIINQNLAKVAAEFGLGMGLGSCRPLLESNKDFEDFNLRPILGSELPFWANLGIAQLEELIESNELDRVNELVEKLDADGLIIHINPLQEWFQPEGDTYKKPALETIEKVIESQIPVVVKEVGQGMGPRSIKKLLELPLKGLELASFGGTNFSKLEKLRENSKYSSKLHDLMFVGHTALEMVDQINLLQSELGENCLCRDIIISGGISDTLYGHWLSEKCSLNSVVGRAKGYLDHATDLDELRAFVSGQIETLKMAKAFLKLR